jgi:hypothetical protein
VLEEFTHYVGILTGICEFCVCLGVVLVLLFVAFGIEGGVIFVCLMIFVILLLLWGHHVLCVPVLQIADGTELVCRGMEFMVVGLRQILNWNLLSFLEMVRSRTCMALFSSCCSVNCIFKLILFKMVQNFIRVGMSSVV